jgi:uncharacterized protein (DUF2237 family)
LIRGAVSNTSLSIFWTNPVTSPGVANNTIYLGTACPNVWLEIISTGGPTNHWDFSGLLPGTTYCIVVTAWTTGVQSAPSYVLLAATNFDPPAQPSGLQVLSVTNTSATLAWTNPPHTIGATVEYGSGGFCNSLGNPQSAGPNVSSYMIVFLTPGTTYCFGVAAWTNGGQGPVATVLGTTTGVAPHGSFVLTTTDVYLLIILGVGLIVLVGVVLVYFGGRRRRPRGGRTPPPGAVAPPPVRSIGDSQPPAAEARTPSYTAPPLPTPAPRSVDLPAR